MVDSHVISNRSMATNHFTNVAIFILFLSNCFVCATSTGALNVNCRKPLSKNGFLRSCKGIGERAQKCDNLWNSFTENFRCPSNNCANPIADQNYRNFILEEPPVVGKNEQMFYSGKTYNSARSYAESMGKKIIEDTTLGSILDKYKWCCADETGVIIVNCKAKSTCSENNTDKFWKFLSEKFAENARGDTVAILNGWASNYKPYSSTSVFYQNEVPNLKGKKVNKMSVILVYEGNYKYWTCKKGGSGLNELRATLRNKSIDYECSEETKRASADVRINSNYEDCSGASAPQSLAFNAMLMMTMLVMLIK